MTQKYVRGGIGDILLSMESAITEKVIDVYSHYSNAPDLFEPFGVKVNRFEYFKNHDELHQIYIPGEELERKTYPKFGIPVAGNRPKGKILGIHIEGSAFSNDIWSKRGQPTKNMSDSFLMNLFRKLGDRYNDILLYIFCSPSRVEDIDILLYKYAVNLYHLVAYPFIWDSLSLVGHCDAILASDSAIKTMGAIQRIPTTVLVGDYADPFRDKMFLDPYVKDGHMNVIKYRNIDEISPEQALKSLL